MSMTIKINPELKDLPRINYNDLEFFQGELKELPKEEYNKLRKSLVEQGLLSPFYVWHPHDHDKNYIIDGHQRKIIFMLERVEPQEVPYILIPGDTIEDAKKNLLAIDSRYGKTTEEGFKQFTIDLPKRWVEDTISYDSLSKALEIAKPLAQIPENINLKPFSKTHILISFPPEKMIDIQDMLKPIIDLPFVEIEQSSN